MPQRTCLRKRPEFGAITALARLLPCSYRAILLDLIKPAEHRLISQVVKLLAAQIIASSFHITDAELAVSRGKERLLKERYVFKKKLLLQVLGPSRNNHALAGADHRHQIGQS